MPGLFICVCQRSFILFYGYLVILKIHFSTAYLTRELWRNCGVPSMASKLRTTSNGIASIISTLQPYIFCIRVPLKLILFNAFNAKKLLYQKIKEFFSPGNVLLSQGATAQVPLALKSLTSVFGMGTGVTSSPSSPDIMKDYSFKTR